MHILNFKAPIKKKVPENRCILWVIDWVDLCIHVPAKYKYQHNLGLTTGGCTSPIGLTWKSYLHQQLFVLNPIWNEYNVNMVFSLIVYKASPKGTLAVFLFSVGTLLLVFGSLLFTGYFDVKVCIVLQVVTNQFHGMHSFENLVLDQHNLISLSTLITFVLDNGWIL